MILYEFHVLQWNTSPVGHSHSVTCLNRPVSSEGENTACSPCAHDNRLCSYHLQDPGTHFNGRYTLAPPIFNQNFGSKPFIMTDDIIVFQRSLEKCMEQMEARFISSKPSPFYLHSSERADSYSTVKLPRPWTAPVLHLYQFFRSFIHK